MDKQIKSKLIFNKYEIDNIKFNINKDYVDNGPIDMDLKFGTEIKLGSGNSAKVKLSVLLFDKCKEQNYPFELSLDVIGDFVYEVEGDCGEEKMLQLCKVHGTTALFPYMRSAVTDITKIANVEPLVMPLINIYNMIKEAEN